MLGIFAVGVGCAFDYFFIPLIIPLYLLLLISGSALFYTNLLNNLSEKTTSSSIPKLIKNLPKPLYSLFFYQIVHRFKLTYGITKLISAILIIGMFALFQDNSDDIRIAGISVLAVTAAHSVLIYQSNEFERSYMSFSRNFPLTITKSYFQLAALYVMMLLPEIILIFCINLSSIAVTVSVLGLGSALLFRILLYWQNQKMGTYLKTVFGLFISAALVVMFGGSLWLIVIFLVVSFLLFKRNYYKLLE